jgi:hypothetical protein
MSYRTPLAWSEWLGEQFHRHEIVHLALRGGPPMFPQLEEAVAFALGGTRGISFDDWACLEQSAFLAEHNSASVAEMIAKHDSSSFVAPFHREAAFAIAVLAADVGTPSLSRMQNANGQWSGRSDFYSFIASELGVPLARVAEEIETRHSRRVARTCSP